MNQVFKASWWISMLTSTLLTIFFIYLLKMITSAVNIPVISKVVQGA